MDGLKYRHELKFLCTQPQLELLEGQISCLMEKDEHSRTEGFYTVRSLYFDDYINSAAKQKEDGLDERSKYRIRSYGQGMDEDFRLEIKHRVRDRISKESCSLPAEWVKCLLRGEDIVNGCEKVGEGTRYDNGVLNRFLIAWETQFLRPAVIVEYDRTPYVYPEGNVRITFDRNICGGPQVEHFTKRDAMVMPILDRGYHLLEVKYDEFLPDIIRHVLQIVSLEKTSFSKYYFCRLAAHPLRMRMNEEYRQSIEMKQEEHK